VQAHTLGEVGILGTVLWRVSSGTILPIFIEIGSYLTEKEQKISWHSFFETRCIAFVYARDVCYLCGFFFIFCVFLWKKNSEHANASDLHCSLLMMTECFVSLWCGSLWYCILELYYPVLSCSILMWMSGVYRPKAEFQSFSHPRPLGRHVVESQLNFLNREEAKRIKWQKSQIKREKQK